MQFPLPHPKFGPLEELESSLACHAGDHGFKSRTDRQHKRDIMRIIIVLFLICYSSVVHAKTVISKPFTVSVTVLPQSSATKNTLKKQTVVPQRSTSQTTVKITYE